MDKPPWADRFMDKVDVRGEDDCWEWKASCQPTGYGQFGLRNTMLYAHRVSFELHNNRPVAKGMCVLHSCDNRKCVNPNHLSEGTEKENIRQAIERKRWNQIGENHYGSKLSRKDCEEIYSLLMQGSQGRKLAAKYKVTESVISEIKNGKHWSTRSKDAIK